MGRLGADGELKTVGESEVLELNVANNVGFGDRKTVQWFRCQVWGKRGAAIKEYCVKGKQMFVTGQLTIREYTNKEGEKRFSHDVRVDQLDFVSDGQRSILMKICNEKDCTYPERYGGKCYKHHYKEKEEKRNERD
jgi:single-strand DNA-binding protein